MGSFMHRYPLPIRKLIFAPENQRFRHILVGSSSLIVSWYCILFNQQSVRISQYFVQQLQARFFLIAKNASFTGELDMMKFSILILETHLYWFLHRFLRNHISCGGGDINCKFY